MFEELQDAFEYLEFRNEDIKKGKLITISAKEGINHSGQLRITNNNFLYTLRVYEDTIPIHLYLEIDSLGYVSNILRESEGTLPELFISPNDSIWSINTCLEDSKNMEIILPLKDRSEIKKVYRYRSFVGEWIGNINNEVFLHNFSYFGKKPDQICKLEFYNNTIVKRKIVKIPHPQKNKVFIDKQSNFQLLAWNEGKLSHRVANQKGEIIAERFIEVEELDCVEVLELSIEYHTYLIGFYDNILSSITITPNGEVIKKKLIELDKECNFYNLWAPQMIDSKKYIINFTGENFNGWAVIDFDYVVECFICHNESNFYKDIFSSSVIELPKSDENHFVISGVSVNNNGTYQIVIYNSNQDKKDLYIISRQY